MSRYRIVTDISTRASPDPASPDYDQWLTFEAGSVAALPEHVDVELLLKRGAIEEAKAKRAAKEGSDGED